MQSSKFASYLGGIGYALSARDYRIYWYGQVFSSHGVWMHRMAVGVLIFQLTGSPAWLGFIGFVYSLPLMILGPIAGAIADRFGIRRTAIIAIVASILVTCLMAALTLSRTMTPVLVAASMVVLGFLHAFDFPVRQVLIQLLVGRDRMSAAIALTIGAQAIGVLIIGWIAEVAGFRVAFGCGAAISLLVVAIIGPGLWRRAGKLEQSEAGLSPPPEAGSAISDTKSSRAAE